MPNDFIHVHLIGIGGISVSAIAKLLLSEGKTVTGSDLVASDITRELEELGMKVFIGQKAEHVGAGANVDLVIYTEAAPEDNAERMTAKERGIAAMSAFQFWGEFSRSKKVIAVSGTNGKSTTAAMLGFILERAGFDPTVVVGTRVLQWQSNIRIGRSDWLVIEADEYHAHMLEFEAHLAVITNIAPDHLDYYKDLDDIVAHFQRWVNKISPDGCLVVNKDDPVSGRLRLTKGTVRQFGLDDKLAARLKLRLPGAFNLANALAAAAAADWLGVKRETIVKALNDFEGTWRRFEKVGEYKGALIISDYAHHPDGIRATLQAARERYPNRRILLLYQPHQHNRTRKLFEDFVTSFDQADELILAEIYDVAGRSADEDKAVSSKDLVKEIKKRLENKVTGAPHPYPLPKGEGVAKKSPPLRGGVGVVSWLTASRVSYASDLETAEQMLRAKIQKNDLVLVMGAGDVDSVARNLVKGV